MKALEQRRDELNGQRFKSIRYEGPGTDLTVDLPREHLWCTASLRSKAGVRFVANLPTEEVFTLPHKDSARGKVRIARPITFGGAVIDGIELEFQRGRVINATARTGDLLLQRLLSTDPGACRLGEVALIVNSDGDPSRESTLHGGQRNVCSITFYSTKMRPVTSHWAKVMDFV